MHPCPERQRNKMLNLCALVALLCLHQRMFCSAFYSAHIRVDYGQPAVLDCDGSTFKEQAGKVHWERRGEDVAVLREGVPQVSEKFKDGLQLPSEKQIKEGNWSVVLRQAKFRHTDMYECMWQEITSISTIWLSVNEPKVSRYINVVDGTPVDLRCFIKPQWNPLQNLLWTWDNKVLISHNLTFSPLCIEEFATSRRSDEEEFYFHMKPTILSGKYQCCYTTGKTDRPKLGFPESYSIIVTPAADVEEASADEWMSTQTTGTPADHLPVHLEFFTQPTEGVSHYKEPDETSTVEEIRTSQEMVTLLPDGVNGVEATEILPVLQEEPTQLFKVAGNLLPKDLPNSEETEIFKEKDIFLYTENLDPTWNVFQLDNLPWVRIGLISGVLLITAVVLCALRARRYI